MLRIKVQTEEYWWQLYTISSSSSGPWAGLGDCATQLEEKKGTLPVTKRDMYDFIQCRAACQLDDPRYVGNRYTWCNQQEGNGSIHGMLDWILISEDCFLSFP